MLGAMIVGNYFTEKLEKKCASKKCMPLFYQLKCPHINVLNWTNVSSPTQATRIVGKVESYVTYITTINTLKSVKPRRKDVN